MMDMLAGRVDAAEPPNRSSNGAGFKLGDLLAVAVCCSF